MSPDVHVLTGAYALNAVNELERVDFERHLAVCEACAEEVRELRDAAARLGRAAALAPPPGLKARVLADIGQVRQHPPTVAPLRLRRPPARWALRLSTAAAAVLLVISATLGVLLVREQQSGKERQEIVAILQANDARVVTGEVDNGGSATVVMSRSQNRAVVLTAGMGRLQPGQVYQAWMVVEDENNRDEIIRTKSAGLVAGSRLDIDVLGAANAFSITVEPEGGSARPNLERKVAYFRLT
ncbi:MAG TPA: anti-sigma factor [Actinophytocola sp.]|uniref:anti-sigma factor n=1 Tax=Actinophytocola sp. TaxID=1872138 RepID=UPI002DB5830D|nr:anti-sigma factor [Actinophytocola sp.]HEU5469267.1 anti-sigma factor [Actinophytocola sp.]